jgi:predicted DNA-binding antitoxin AbrB/MazE fold protein
MAFFQRFGTVGRVEFRSSRLSIEGASVQAIPATYEGGVFKPAEHVNLPEGFRVTLWVDPLTVPTESQPQDSAYLEDLAENRGEVLRRMGE